MDPFVKSHLQLSSDGFLFIVLCCPLINHPEFLGGRFGTTPTVVCPNAIIATNYPPVRKADALVTLWKGDFQAHSSSSHRGKPHFNKDRLLWAMSELDPFALRMVDRPE